MGVGGDDRFRPIICLQFRASRNCVSLELESGAVTGV